MSAPQLKMTLMMAEPRVVEERTDTTPGMLFIASSMGRVMVAIISLAGMMPLFTRTTTRGKSVRGNTDDGVCRARKNSGQAQRHRDERDGHRVPRGEPAQA